MNDRTPFITAEPTQAEIVNRLSRANSHVLHELADLITVFGAHGELSGADFVENAGGIFAKMLHAAGLPAMTGTTTSLTWWRAVAEGRGIEHDGEYGLDTASSASSQHFIDTGRYLTHVEKADFDSHQPIPYTLTPQ